MKFEVVEYRNCDCNLKGCPGEKETVLFEHKAKEECIDFMLKFPYTINTYTETLIFDDDKDKIEIKVHLFNGRICNRKLRVQQVL